MSRVCLVFLFTLTSALATIFGTMQGVVHDPSHRPVAGVQVMLRAVNSNYEQTAQTSDQGEFEFRAVPVGEYRVRLAHTGFADAEQSLVVASGTAPVLHVQLKLAQQKEAVEVSESAEAVNPQSATPSTLITRQDIQQTPGADLSNSPAIITNYVPGA